MRDEFINFSVQKLRQLAERIEACVGSLTDDQIWWRGAETQNAVGNLVLHLAGNLGQWILSGIGGMPDTRDRDTEFAARGNVGRDELLQLLRSRVEAAVTVLEGVSEQRLSDRLQRQQYDVSVLENIYHVVEHFSQHAGQIMYATKLLTARDLGFYKHLNAPVHGEKTP